MTRGQPSSRCKELKGEASHGETMGGSRQGWAEQQALSLLSLPQSARAATLSINQRHHLSLPPVALCPLLPSSEEGKEVVRTEAVALTQGPHTCFLVSISEHKRKV